MSDLGVFLRRARVDAGLPSPTRFVAPKRWPGANTRPDAVCPTCLAPVCDDPRDPRGFHPGDICAQERVVDAAGVTWWLLSVVIATPPGGMGVYVAGWQGKRCKRCGRYQTVWAGLPIAVPAPEHLCTCPREATDG